MGTPLPFSLCESVIKVMNFDPCNPNSLPRPLSVCAGSWKGVHICMHDYANHFQLISSVCHQSLAASADEMIQIIQLCNHTADSGHTMQPGVT